MAQQIFARNFLTNTVVFIDCFQFYATLVIFLLSFCIFVKQFEVLKISFIHISSFFLIISLYFHLLFICCGKPKTLAPKYKSQQLVACTKSIPNTEFYCINFLIYFSNRYGKSTEEIKIAVVLCGGSRFNQTVVTLKSAAVFSKATLHFIIIADEENKEKITYEVCLFLQVLAYFPVAHFL